MMTLIAPSDKPVEGLEKVELRTNFHSSTVRVAMLL